MLTTEHLEASAATAEASLAAAVLAVSAEGRGSLAAKLLTLILGASSGPGGLLLHGGRDNVGRKGKVSAEVVKASLASLLSGLSNEVAVVVLPGEGDADETPGLEGLHEHHDLKVGDTLDLRVGLCSGVLLNNADSLLEKVGVDGDTVLLGNEHVCLYRIDFGNTKTWAARDRQWEETVSRSKAGKEEDVSGGVFTVSV